MSFRYQMSSHNKVLLSAPSLFIQNWSFGGGDRVNTFVKQSMYIFFDGGSHVSGRKIWINFEAHQGFILLINPWKKFSDLRLFSKCLAEPFLRLLRWKDVRGWILIFWPQKNFLNFDGLQSWYKSFFQTLVGCPFFLVSITTV